MSDIVKRLRQRAKPLRQRIKEKVGDDLRESYDHMILEAADTIESLRAELAALRKDAAKQEPDISIWYMRDNHTFLQLPLDVKAAIELISHEFAAGYSHGMLCSKHPAMAYKHVHGNGSIAWHAFETEAREWLASAIDAMQPKTGEAT
jgi:hypothetical protein